MGLDTIPTRAGGIVKSSWFNVFRSVLIGALVPRNSSGAPEDFAGDLGSTLYPWSTAFVTALSLRADADAYEYVLEAPAGMVDNIEVTLPATLPVSITPVLIDENGVMTYGQVPTSGIEDDAITYAKRSAFNYALSTEVTGYTNSSTTFSTIATVSITTEGKPVMLGLVPSNASNAAALLVAGTALSALGALFRVKRDATILGIASEYVSGLDSGDHSLSLETFLAGFIDFPAAGTYTYTLEGAIPSIIADGELSVNYVKFIAQEWG